MSLSDLKKGNQNKVKRKNFTVDEFIADAKNYAEGKPEVVSHQADSLEKINLQKQHKSQNVEQNSIVDDAAITPPFRRSTFTLSEEAIGQLQLLSQETQLAKSHIIRILIEVASSADQTETLKKILSSYKE